MDLIRQETILMSFSLKKKDQDLSEIPIYIAKYDVRGNFISFLPLTNELTLCPFSTKDTQEYLRFGNQFNVTCFVDLERIFQLEEEQHIYEMYIRNSATDTYIDIPVAITNYLKSGNSKTNQEIRDLENLTLVRRFMKYDILTGIDGTKASQIRTDYAKAIRFIRDATLIIESVDNDDQRIYRPYLVLTYGEQTYEKRSELAGSQASIGV